MAKKKKAKDLEDFEVHQKGPSFTEKELDNMKAAMEAEPDVIEMKSEPEPFKELKQVVDAIAPEPEVVAPPKEPEPQKAIVPLVVFLKVAGPKWDQLAGFKHYAKKNSLGPMSVEEWRAALKHFMNKPMN